MYNTHLNDKIEEVVMGFPVLPTEIISFFDEKKVNDFSPQFFFQIREWMIHFKSGLAVAQVIVGDLLFEIEMWLIVITSKFLKKNVKSLE